MESLPMAAFRFCSLSCVGLLFLTAGCAPAYHSYQCASHGIPYDYCPSAPLPYTLYCGCPTPVASCYANRDALAEGANDAAVVLPEPGSASPETAFR
jgi:hypothetical protein